MLKLLRAILVAALAVCAWPVNAAFDQGNLICETTTTTGTGTVNLSESGCDGGDFVTFASQITSGDTTTYTIVASDGTLETGTGVYTAGSPDTMSRTPLWSSAGSATALTLPAGTHRVYVQWNTASYQGGLNAFDIASLDVDTVTGVDSIDTDTETTIEAAIDTLANLASVQSQTILLTDDNLDVLFGWDDSDSQYESLGLAEIATEAAPAAGDFALIYGAEGDLRKVDWSSMGGVSDGDKGDITVSSSGAVWEIDANVVGPTEIDETASYDWTGIHTFDADSVQIDDTNASHQLILTPGSDLTADRVLTLTTGDAARTVTLTDNVSLGDGDKGDITVSSDFTVFTIDNDVVTYAKMQNVAADERVLGRVSGAGGDVEELSAAQISAFMCGTDPAADRIAFWDDSAGACAWLTPALPLLITTTTIDVNAATTTTDGVVELAIASEYWTGTDTARPPAIDQIWASAAIVTLTDAASIVVTMSSFINANVVLAGNRTLANPTAEKVGQTGVILVTATTSTRTLALSSEWRPATGIEAFPISVTTSETVMISYWVQSSTITWITAVLRRTT